MDLRREVTIFTYFFVTLMSIPLVECTDTLKNIAGRAAEDCTLITYWDEGTLSDEFCLFLCNPGGGQGMECNALCQAYLECQKRMHAISPVSPSKDPDIQQRSTKANDSTTPRTQHEMILLVMTVLCGIMGLVVLCGLIYLLVKCFRKRCKNIRVRKGGTSPEDSTQDETWKVFDLSNNATDKDDNGLPDV